MPRSRVLLPQVWVAAVVTLTLGGAASAQTVWSGFEVAFMRPNDSPLTQDQITSNVRLARNVQQGIFNSVTEAGYVGTSPAGTAWATNINNPGKTIAAANWAALQFKPWIDAYGGTGSMSLPATLTSRNAVLHLLTDNIYLDIQFTDWTQSAGGGFAYERAAAPAPPPTTGDYNGDHEVNAADYVVWRDTLGDMVAPPGSGADGDQSSTIDDGDYTFWKSKFGNTVPASSASITSATVPEPKTALIVLISLCGVTLYSGNRSR
jgi:hypothetical protein